MASSETISVISVKCCVFDYLSFILFMNMHFITNLIILLSFFLLMAPQTISYLEIASHFSSVVLLLLLHENIPPVTIQMQPVTGELV